MAWGAGTRCWLEATLACRVGTAQDSIGSVLESFLRKSCGAPSAAAGNARPVRDGICISFFVRRKREMMIGLHLSLQAAVRLRNTTSLSPLHVAALLCRSNVSGKSPEFSIVFAFLARPTTGICGDLWPSFSPTGKAASGAKNGRQNNLASKRSETLRQYMTNIRAREGRLDSLAAVF